MQGSAGGTRSINNNIQFIFEKEISIKTTTHSNSYSSTTTLNGRTAMIKLKVIRIFNIARVQRAVLAARENLTHSHKREKRKRGSKHVVDMCVYMFFLSLFIVIYLTPDSDQDNFLLGSMVRRLSSYHCVYFLLFSFFLGKPTYLIINAIHF